MIVAPWPQVPVQSKSIKGKCQSNNKTAYALDNCGSETSGICPVIMAKVQSKSTKGECLWLIMAPKFLVSVQLKSTIAACQSNNQTAYALNYWGSEISGVCYHQWGQPHHLIDLPYQQLVTNCPDHWSHTPIYSQSNEHRLNMNEHRTCCILLHNLLMWEQAPIKFSRAV